MAHPVYAFYYNQSFSLRNIWLKYLETLETFPAQMDGFLRNIEPASQNRPLEIKETNRVLSTHDACVTFLFKPWESKPANVMIMRGIVPCTRLPKFHSPKEFKSNTYQQVNGIISRPFHLYSD